jgi:hypothetical protein
MKYFIEKTLPALRGVLFLITGTPVVQDYRQKWAKPSLTTPDRSCMVRIGPDFVRIDPDFVRIDPDHSGSILQ